MRKRLVPVSLTMLGALVLPACAVDDASDAAPAADFPCDPDDGGITLPDGFCATVFADGLGVARHMAIRDNGDVYVARRPAGGRGGTEQTPGGVTALRDSDGDGKADVIETVNEIGGTGIGIHDGYLYFSNTTEVFRVALDPDALVPVGESESVVSGFISQGQHADKTLAFDDTGNLYVNVGAPSNACRETMRTPGSPGPDPCPQLDRQAGIWRFEAGRIGQTQEADGVRYATGIRNAVAITWNPATGALYTMQHGRDSLSQLYPALYTNEASAELPAEELQRLSEGADFGWPYCYYDGIQGRRVLAPEYGGDGGTEAARCAAFEDPVVAFPAHWAPNDLLFYRGGSFPEHYDNGAFVAFHGSWNRMPFPQQGYQVMFVPFADGVPVGDPEPFADDFAGVDEVRMPGNAAHRPTGLAQGPDGSLYVSDSRGGRIWRIRAVGS